MLDGSEAFLESSTPFTVHLRCARRYQHMFQEAKWLGLSLALHLAVAVSLFMTASRNVERTPKVITVVLDSLALPELPQHKSVRATETAAVRPPLPARLPEPARPEMTRQATQPAVPQAQPAQPALDPSRPRELPKASPEVPAVSINRPRVDAAPATASAYVKAPVQTPATAEERPAAEKIQQRYLKEHFAYIRDLITKHITYPPMARRMGWSGKVVVAFIIAEDGSVHNVRVVESSGFPILDKSASETVRSAAPYPKPPVRAEIVAPVNFRMM